MANAPLDAFGARKAQAQQAVNVALADAKTMLGKNEVPNRSELQQYLQDGGEDLDPHKLAWCAAFVSASLQKAGLPVPTQVVKGSAFGPGAYAPNYLTYGSAVNPKNVQAGDILVANNGTHVGFAEGPIRQGPNGPEAQLLAGNERDPSGQYAPGSYTSPTGAVANRSQVGMVGERWVPLSQYSARRYEPPDDGSQPAAAPSQGTAPATQSSGLNLGNLSAAIKQQESNGDYTAVNRSSGALGAYQIMPYHLPEWGKAAGYEGITAAQFLANPKAQDDIANAQLKNYANQYGNARDVASVWYGGPKAVGNPNIPGGKGYPTTGAYASQVLDKYNALGGGTATATPSTAPAPPGTTLTSVGGGDVSKLPGFGTAAASKSFTEGLEKLAPGLAGGGGAGGQGGQDQQPQPSPILQAPPPRNVAPPLAPAMEAQLTGYMPKPYGQTLNSFATPLEWGSTPPGASPYAPGLAAGANPLSVQPPATQQGAGTQMAATSPIGTSLSSLDPEAYQQRLAMLYGTTGGQGGYGGGY